MANLLEVHGLYKSFGKHQALNNLSLAVPEGSIFGLLGPNGAGKTTLLRIINQITLPDSGRVLLDGQPLHPRHIQTIGYLPEERGLYKSMRVGEQVMYLAQLKGLSKKEARERLNHWFNHFGITDWWSKKIQELSKGMAQKVQFIVTVLHQPKLLIFDEPFSGFDPINANVIKDEILKLRDAGATVIFSTHRMESVEEMCDHIALINKAEKILDGPLNEVKQRFSENVFQVGISPKNAASFKSDLEGRYQVTPANFKSLVPVVKLTVKLNAGDTPNKLLNYLTAQGELTHFVAQIPTVNDIFIKAIKQQQ